MYVCIYNSSRKFLYYIIEAYGRINVKDTVTISFIKDNFKNYLTRYMISSWNGFAQCFIPRFYYKKYTYVRERARKVIPVNSAGKLLATNDDMW